MQQKRGVRMDGNPGANLAQFTSLFKDGDVQSTRPQGERGRQATNPAANDGDLKWLRHDLLLSQGYQNSFKPSGPVYRELVDNPHRLMSLVGQSTGSRCSRNDC